MVDLRLRRSFLQASLAIGSLALGASRSSGSLGNEKPRIKIGQIGVGHAHATKLEVYRNSPDYEVVGLVEPDKELRERAQTLPVFRDVPLMTEEQLLAVPGLAAVLVETRVRDLLNTAQRCV